MNCSWADRLALTLTTLFTLVMVVLAITGGIHFYSAVPYQDMWSGTLNFFMQIQEGDYTRWWSLHNEHRIVLSRLLFWMDMVWFGGTSRFLIVMNYVLAGISAFTFWRIVRNYSTTSGTTPGLASRPAINEILLGMFLTAWLFLWIQQENLTWAFQSQFFLAQLLPLCAFYWLYQSTPSSQQYSRNFTIAYLFGIASTGTMANGLLALPLMAIYALLTRQGGKRIALLFASSALFLSIHLQNAQSLNSVSLLAHPLERLQYVLLYLGSPFHYLSGGTPFFSFYLAQLAGLALMSCAVCLSCLYIRNPGRHAFPLFLLCFIFYVALTAFVTASGRLHLGVEQALSSRYTTPALMGWAALFVLLLPFYSAANKHCQKIITGFLVVLMGLMLPPQLKALQPPDALHFAQNGAALALALGVRDANQIHQLIYSVDVGQAIADRAISHNFSIFSAYPYHGIRKQMGTLFPQNPALPECSAVVDITSPISEDNRFRRVIGWIFDPNGPAPTPSSPSVIRFLNSEGRMVGYGLTGHGRDDVAAAVHDARARYSGYSGYLLSDTPSGVLIVQGENASGPSCRTYVNVAMP